MRKMHLIDLETVPVLHRHDEKEQIRRVVTRSRQGYEQYGFGIVHFDQDLEKDMEHAENTEVVWFVLQGSAVLTWEEGRMELRPSSTVCFAPQVSYHHETGPQGLTVAVCASPPAE